MKKYLFLLSVFLGWSANAATTEVSNQEAFNKAQAQARAGDIISWLPGTYHNIYLYITKNNITVKSKFPGKTIFTGASKAYIRGDEVTFEGFQFIDGNIGSGNIITISGSRNHISELNISGYTSYKYLVIANQSQYNRISRCNFENRINLADKNILSVGVSDKHPGFHKIEYCSFKNFKGTGGDMGIEPIRIGLSSKSQFDSKTIVEFCYFSACNGDGELISNKSGKNILRYNTFENNPLAELVLRHGSDTYVYGNFFLNGKGGIRIREGSNHYLFNNYFSGLKSRSIILNSGTSDPIKNVYIMHNTFVKSARLHLGGNREVSPKKVVLANNLFALPHSASIAHISGKETWIGNMYAGNLGISEQKGLKEITTFLYQNQFDFFEMESRSPAVDAAEPNKIKLPAFGDLDADWTLASDILRQERPLETQLRDVGCLEVCPNTAPLRPVATTKTTGPSYLKYIPKMNESGISKIAAP